MDLSGLHMGHSPLRDLEKGTETKTMKEHTYVLALCGLLRLVSYTTHDHLPVVALPQVINH